MRPVDDVKADVINAAIRIYRELGSGLFGSVCEIVLAASLEWLGYRVDRQKPVDFEFDGMGFPAAFRLDLLVDELLVVENKSVEQLSPAHAKQLLTYLRLTDQPVGLLLNFAGLTMKERIRAHRQQLPIASITLCASASARIKTTEYPRCSTSAA
jgi:iron complex transport system substrate-binding protein